MYTWPAPLSPMPPSWERSLAQAALEQIPSLFLCFDVPLTALGESSSQRLPCLICSQTEIVLALTKRAKTRIPETIPTLHYPYGKEDHTPLLRWLKWEKEPPPEKSRRPHPFRFLPAGSLRSLERQDLIFSQKNGCLPSDYGESLGLLRCAVLQDQQVRYVPCASPLWREPPAAEPLWPQSPLAVRLERLRQGQASTPGYSLALVRRFGALRIGDLFQNYPSGLWELEKEKIHDFHTLQQAAYRIHCLLQDPQTRQTGCKLMLTLAKPITQDLEERGV